MRKRYLIFFMLAVVLLCLAAGFVYNLPPVHERLSWRIASWRAQAQRALNPPEQMVFVPQEQGNPEAVETMVAATLQAVLPSATPSPPSSATPTTTVPGPTATSNPTATSTPTSTPIPDMVLLTGITHEYQQFNNCGPANLAMALSYWGWQGDQSDTRAFLRPNRDVDDKNVMPAEMVAFVETHTNLRALTRVGGDLDLLKRLIAAGFPVLIEMGHHPPDDWWMGHFVVINAYDDERQRFTTQDSLIMPDFPLSYEDIGSRWWRDFNYVYLVIYPPEREDEVMAILGPRADQDYSYQAAARRAVEEFPDLVGRDLFFAWFNLGASLVELKDYGGAAEAFDKAFSIYATLSEEDRPYRMLWYRVDPYPAYYHTGRYQDVVDLANATFYWVGQQILEETFYWRGMAYEALGDLDSAISDFKKAASLNPNFIPPQEALQRLGVEIP